MCSQRVRKVQSNQVPVGGEKGKINGPLLGDWSSFCQSLCLSFWVNTWIHIRKRHRHSGLRLSCSVVHFSFRGRAGLWDGVGDCHDVANPSRVCLFFFPFFIFYGRINLTLFFNGMVLVVFFAAGYASS